MFGRRRNIPMVAANSIGLQRPHGHPQDMEPELPAMPFRPAPGVIGTRVRDSFVLLDRSRERYLTLNEVAADVWEQLAAGLQPLAIVATLCTVYDTSPQEVRVHVAAEIGDLLGLGLIEPADHPGTGAIDTSAAHLPTAHPTRSFRGCRPATQDTVAPSHFRCALLIAGLKLRLALEGFEGTRRWVQRRVGSPPIAPDPSVEWVRAVERRVATAAALFPGRVRCLEQSLALYYLMRRHGIPVTFAMGVQPFPFLAHAWIEYKGQVVNDVPEHVSWFARLPDVLP